MRLNNWTPAAESSGVFQHGASSTQVGPLQSEATCQIYNLISANKINERPINELSEANTTHNTQHTESFDYERTNQLKLPIPYTNFIQRVSLQKHTALNIYHHILRFDLVYVYTTHVTSTYCHYLYGRH